MILDDSPILGPLKSTTSARPVHSRVLCSEKCCSSLTSRSIRDGMLLSTWTARPTRSLGTKLASCSCRPGALTFDACIGLLSTSGLAE